MLLTLDNTKRLNDIFYWDIPFNSYKIQSITVTTNNYSFIAFYNYNLETGEGVEQYLQSGRTDDTNPSMFNGPFSVFFKLGYEFISEVNSIYINIESV